MGNIFKTNHSCRLSYSHEFCRLTFSTIDRVLCQRDHLVHLQSSPDKEVRRGWPASRSSRTLPPVRWRVPRSRGWAPCGVSRPASPRVAGCRSACRWFAAGRCTWTRSQRSAAGQSRESHRHQLGRGINSPRHGCTSLVSQELPGY